MHMFIEQFHIVSDFPLEHLATTSLFPVSAGVTIAPSGNRDIEPCWSDTAFYRYQHYHSASDTPDKISYPRFTQAVIGLHNTFSRIAASGLPV